MKNIILISCLIFTTLSCKAQIEPVQNQINYRNSDNGIPEGTYLKDVDNLFDPFIGTWTGTYNNNNYEFNVIETIKQTTNSSRDRLLISYKITDAANNTIIDTTILPDDSIYQLRGDMFLGNGRTYSLFYAGYESNCGQNGTVTIAVINNGTQMNLGLILTGDSDLDNCPSGVAEQVLPLDNMVLTKQ